MQGVLSHALRPAQETQFLTIFWFDTNTHLSCWSFCVEQTWGLKTYLMGWFPERAILLPSRYAHVVGRVGMSKHSLPVPALEPLMLILILWHMESRTPKAPDGRDTRLTQGNSTQLSHLAVADHCIWKGRLLSTQGILCSKSQFILNHTHDPTTRSLQVCLSYIPFNKITVNSALHQ